jgi:hypothetical protein
VRHHRPNPTQHRRRLRGRRRRGRRRRDIPDARLRHRDDSSDPGKRVAELVRERAIEVLRELRRRTHVIGVFERDPESLQHRDDLLTEPEHDVRSRLVSLGEQGLPDVSHERPTYGEAASESSPTRSVSTARRQPDGEAKILRSAREQLLGALDDESPVDLSTFDARELFELAFNLLEFGFERKIETGGSVARDWCTEPGGLLEQCLEMITHEGKRKLHALTTNS